MPCDGCGGRMYYHEREAHPQAFCFKCASERGLTRICDTPGPDMSATAISEKVVAEMLDTDLAAKEMARIAEKSLADALGVAPPPDPDRAAIVQVLRRAAVPRGGGIVVFVLGGQRLADDVVMDAVAGAMTEGEPHTFYVVPHGWVSRVKKIAAEEGLVAIADNLVEAAAQPFFDVIAYVELEVDEEPAVARAVDRWFDNSEPNSEQEEA